MAVAVTATHVGSEKLESEIRAAVEHAPADHEDERKESPSAIAKSRSGLASRRFEARLNFFENGR